MARKATKSNESLVHVIERENLKGIRFYLTYMIGDKEKGEQRKQVREALHNIPLVSKKDKAAYADSKRLAESIAEQRTKEIRDFRLGFRTESEKRLMLSDWMQQVAEDVERRQRNDLNRHTYSRKIILAKKAILEYTKGEDVRLANVDKSFLLGFIDWLRNVYTIQRHVQNAGEHLSSATSNERYKAVVYALRKAVKNGMIARNPAEQIDKEDKIHTIHEEWCFLTIEELKRLEATPTAAYETMRVFLFMCNTGLRISDAKSLKWSDVRVEDGVVAIRKRQKKTQESVYIPLSNKAVALLPERGEKSGDDVVFDELPTEPAMNRNLKYWAKIAGIDKNLTLHTARHTFCTWLLTKGVDLYTVSQLAGHTNIKTTQIYAKIVDEKKRAAVSLLDD